jgi:hypothetical protein
MGFTCFKQFLQPPVFTQMLLVVHASNLVHRNLFEWAT